MVATSGATPSPTPNGYRFFPVYTPGNAGLSAVKNLTPQIIVDDAGHIVFYGQDNDGGYGLYQITLDYTASTPQVVSGRTIVAAGQTLGDGRVVANVASTDVNSGGTVAAAVNFDPTQGPAGLGPSAVFVDRGQGLVKIADFNDTLPGNAGDFGGDFGDLDIHDNDDVMMVGRYGTGGDTAQGVFFLPGAAESNARLLMSSGQEVPQADGSIQNIGLIDLDDDGDYVAQGFGTNVYTDRRSTGQPQYAGSFIIQGNVNQPLSEARLLAACPTLPLSRAARSTSSSATVGTSLYGPRIGGHKIATWVTEAIDGTVRLFRNGVVIAQSGQNSPGGSPIDSVTSAVVGSSGLTFYELLTEGGLELCAHNGSTATLLLSRGATVGGMQVDTLAFGFHSTQTDKSGRIVGYAQMTNGQEYILVGVPV